MFKSVFNSLHNATSVEHHQRQQQQDNASTKSNDSEITVNNNNNTGGKRSSMKLMSVKAGRKRFSSMMNRFRGSNKQDSDVDDEEEQMQTKDLERKGRGHDYRADDVDVDDDDIDDVGDGDGDDEDDAAYKSAEDACRKMSISGEPLELGKSTSRRNSNAQGGGAKKAGRKHSTYEQLKDDKKYILPEEQCDIPTFLETKNCDPYLIEETRRLLKERYVKNPDNFYDADYKRMLTDDWTVSRFLLRRRLDPKRTAKLMEECGRFRKQYKMSEVQLWEFPMEFHKAGGLFMYAPDRVGNVTMYMRVKMYRRVPEISDVFKAFILCVLEQCDVVNNGRGTAVIFDLSSCGLQNVDLGFLSWLLSSFRNYCPKGVSYILVYNLPWILNATCKLAMTWMSASNKRALRFVYGDEIENFIERSNLPDYLGGECKLNYRAIPPGSKPAIEVCDRLDMTREQAIKIRELFKEYLDDEDNDDDNGHQDLVEEHENHIQDPKMATDLTRVELEQANANLASNGCVPVVDLVSRASKFISH